MEPLLKWPGGKRLLVKHLLPTIPESFRRYYEPFFGGGALFFALEPECGVISDSNLELVNCYRQIRNRPQAVVAWLKAQENSERAYYRVRAMEPKNSVEAAGRTLYLATLAFNGIYRQNLRGKFNVPYGYKTHLSTCDETRILAASRILRKAELRRGDFEDVVRDCG